MPITPHGQSVFASAASFHLRHRQEIRELFISEEIRCRRTGFNTPGTWHVARRNSTDIFVTEMIFNWRIITSPVEFPLILNGGWCYFGKDFDSFTRALAAAHAFTPCEGSEPEGYDKEVLPFAP